jgi:hypothetical protein
MVKKFLLIGLLSFACVFSSSLFADVVAVPANIDTQAKLLSARAVSLNPQAIKLGLEAYYKARQQGLDSQQLLTIVDYSKPSVDPRFFVFDLKANQLLFQELVAHGQNSGGNDAHYFSNSPESHASSLGLYLTEQTYTGHHGYSLRLAGLESGYNNMAEAREIVVHAANYVSANTADALGRLGRSWGCFALNPSVAPRVISTIKNGTLLFAYYPDRNWLSSFQNWLPQARLV